MNTSRVQSISGKRGLAMLCAILIGISLFAFSTESVFAASKVLGISRTQQTYDKWCWAASCEMIGRLVRPSVYPTQSAIVYNIFGTTPNVGGTDTQIVTSLAFATGKTAYQTGAYSYASITSTMDGGKALIMKLTWTNGSGHHAVVMSGYDTAGSLVRLTDPWTNCGSNSYGYSNLINGTSVQSGTGYYSRTFYHGS